MTLSGIINVDKVTAFILTQNNERTIGKCINSVSWCDEIIVIDSYSDDKTLDIIREHPLTRIFQHQYTNAREQRIWGMQYVSTKWVFIIDSDEYCPEMLKNKIKEILNDINDKYDGFLFFTRTLFMGKLLNHQDYLSSYGKRLVLSSVATRYWKDTRVHASIRLDNKKYIEKSCFLVHDPIGSIHQHMVKVDKYAYWQAQDMYDSGKKISWYHLLLRPIGKFLKHYIIYRGFMDGLPGLIICMMGAWSVFLKFLYLKEMQYNATNK
jgi:glycosyltransferase involved in cell wall biosynthesis